GQPSRIAAAGAVLASLMVCVLGNVGGFIQLIGQLGQVMLPGPLTSVPILGPIIGLLDGLVLIATGARPFVLPQDWYWSSTRMLALLDVKGGTGSINEFPYFTFLFADLHAHLIGLPFTLLAIALCVNVVKSGGLFRQ